MSITSPTTSPPIDCSEYQVDDTSELFSILNAADDIKYDSMLKCLQHQIIDKDASLNQYATNYGVNKLEAISASQRKVNSEHIYKENVVYTTSKVFMFILLIVSYIYFFKDTGILEPIKNSVNSMMNYLDKLKEIKLPTIKLPEVTMPSIKMSTK